MPSVAPLTFVLCAAALCCAMLGAAILTASILVIALALETYIGLQRGREE